MDEITEALKKDLALQKKKLGDLETWESDALLIESQKSIINEIEKKIEAMQNAA